MERAINIGSVKADEKNLKLCFKEKFEKKKKKSYFDNSSTISNNNIVLA